jgi:DNA polymerase III epsilon subunit-like protein
VRDVIVFDCEYATSETAPRRFWNGPYDPDPVVFQIGAVRLGLGRPFELLDTFRTLVRPRDRHGKPVPVDPFFTRLTGIAAEDVARHGTGLAEALDALARFAGGASLWSWGKDEINTLATSCFVEGIPPPIPAARFGNACTLLLAAGIPYEDVQRLRSNTLAAHFGLEPRLRAHDALDDAMSVALALRHLLRTGRLEADAFDPARPPPPLMPSP